MKHLLLKRKKNNSVKKKSITFLIVSCLLLVLIANKQLYSQKLTSTNYTIENQFPSNTIYDMIMGNDGYIYIATDIGLYKFDGTKTIPILTLKKGGITNLQLDKNGNLYCFSFSNEILKVVGDSLVSILNWKTRHKNNFTHYTINTQKDKMSLSSDNGFLYTYDLITKKIDSTSFLINNIISENTPTLSNNNKIYYSYSSLPNINKTGYYTSNNKQTIYLHHPEGAKKGFSTGSFFQHNKSIFYINTWRHKENKVYKLRNDSLLLFDKINKALLTNHIIKMITSVKNILICTENGLYIYDSTYTKTTHLLPDLKITSAILKDNSLWVSTLNNGLFYYPNIKIETLSTPSQSKNDEIYRLIYVKNKLYFATKKGNIYSKNKANNPTLFYSKEFSPSSSIYFEYNSWNNNLYLYNNDEKNTILLFDLTKGNIFRKPVNPNKAISFFKSNIIASATGASFIIGEKKIINNIPQNIQKVFPLQPLPDGLSLQPLFKERSNCNNYNHQDSSIWIGSKNNLYRLDRKKIDTITLNNKPISAHHICSDQYGNTYIATGNGVLEFKENKLTQKYNIENGLINNQINKIRSHKSHIYFISHSGFQQYNIKTKKFKTYTQLNGLPSNIINDVTETNEFIYVATSKGLTQIPIDIDPSNKLAPQLFLNKILINNIPIVLTNKSLDLGYNENYIDISLNSLSLKSEGNTFFKYMLKSIDKEIITERSKNGLLTVRYKNLDPGKYIFNAHLINENGIKSKELNITFNIATPYWKTWWFYLFIIIGVVIITASGFSIRIRILKKQNELEKKTIKSEIKALKSQMNPHFIFNALNSIQGLILTQNVKKSSIYLGKFSTLVREVLEVSAKENITLEREIEILSIYLDLEELRFEENFTSTIITDESLDIHQLSVPPLIIQPYIENAIKHGLLHKDNDRKLTIRFVDDNERFKCVITDNGIGRAASMKINKQIAKHHKSFASEATEKRIDLVNSFLEEKIYLEIIDKEVGTEVILNFYKE